MQAGNPEVADNKLQELDIVEIRVKDQRGFHRVVETVEQCSAKGCFPCADLSGNDQDPRSILDPIEQMRKGFVVPRTGEKEFRIGSVVERIFFELIK